ncbi:MAG: TolC family protein, partial [Terriglobales bacterium]
MNTRFLVHTLLLAASFESPCAVATDLDDVYQRAVANDPLIREADANRLAARESKPQAWAALLPQIDGQGSYDDFDRTNTFTDIDPPDPPLQTDQDRKGDTTQWQLQLRQSVFSWQNWAALRRASAEVAQAESDYQAAQQDLILRTSEAYF